jgi:hypothetical protein
LSKGQPLWNYYFTTHAPDPLGFLWNVTDCGLRACSDPGAFYGTFKFTGNTTAHAQGWNAFTGTWSAANNGSSGTNNFNFGPNSTTILGGDGVGDGYTAVFNGGASPSVSFGANNISVGASFTITPTGASLPVPFAVQQITFNNGSFATASSGNDLGLHSAGGGSIDFFNGSTFIGGLSPTLLNVPALQLFAATLATTATAGSASALPATPQQYVDITINGVAYKIALYLP